MGEDAEIKPLYPPVSDLRLQRFMVKLGIPPSDGLGGHIRILDRPVSDPDEMLMETLYALYLPVRQRSNFFLRHRDELPPEAWRPFERFHGEFPYEQIDQTLQQITRDPPHMARMMTECVRGFGRQEEAYMQLREDSEPPPQMESQNNFVRALLRTERRVVFYGWDPEKNHDAVIRTINELRERGTKLYMVYRDESSGRSHFISVPDNDAIARRDGSRYIAPELARRRGEELDYPLRFVPGSESYRATLNGAEFKNPRDAVLIELPFDDIDPNLCLSVVDINRAFFANYGLFIPSREGGSAVQGRRYGSFYKVPVVHKGAEKDSSICSIIDVHRVGRPPNILMPHAVAPAIAYIDSNGYRHPGMIEFAE